LSLYCRTRWHVENESKIDSCYGYKMRRVQETELGAIGIIDDEPKS
jgi:hypothetical protein